MQPIYLDYNATTPMHPEVLQAMLPYFTEHFGNPDSRSHAYGWQAKAACDVARQSILEHLDAPQNGRLVFTASATEANNLALKGVVEAFGTKPVNLITQKTEHSCVLETCRSLAQKGHQVTFLDVDAEGFVDPSDLKKALTPHTVLVSLMGANNEIGTIQNLDELISVTRQNSKAFFHSDMVQQVGKMPVSLRTLDLDFLSLSAHKIYGPKGVGGLYLGSRVTTQNLVPQQHGGGHEWGLRSGTLNVPGIVGFAKAFAVVMADLPNEMARLTQLREYFLDGLLAIEGVHLNGPRANRLCNNVNVWIENVLAEQLILAIPKLAFSTGAACASGKTEPSYVIQALGRSVIEARSSVRFGLGRTTTKEQIDFALAQITSAIAELRGQG